MIRKLLLILLLISIITAPLAASQEEWLWFFKASDPDGASGAPGGYIGTTNNDIDGYQSTRDKYLDLSLLSSSASYGVYHVNGSDWSGPTGYYRQDMRAPLNESNKEKSWHPLYVWAGPNYQGNEIKLSWSPGMSGNYLPVDSVSYILTLLDNKGIPGAPANGTFWILSPQISGSIHLPVLRTSNPNIDGYVFQFKASLIPEPGSFATIIVGMFGIAGNWLRRRKIAKTW